MRDLELNKTLIETWIPVGHWRLDAHFYTVVENIKVYVFKIQVFIDVL